MKIQTHMNVLFRTALSFFTAGLFGLSVIGCGEKSVSFDLLSESATFNQSSAEVNGKIDVLWVIDNSGSMETSQQAVAANFSRFIEKFRANGFDFQIAVTTSDAYKDVFSPALLKSDYAAGSYTDGVGTVVTAPAILTNTTPNLEMAFKANILRGINGSGDERAFQSLKAALSNSSNKALGFPRADAHLSVIIVSDEDDFSWDETGSLDSMYADPRLHTAQSYVDFLDGITGSTQGSRYHSVSSIGIFDENCRVNLGGGVRKIADRYHALTGLTGGILGSLCDDFGTTLANISNRTIELSTRFFLDREPVKGTLRVYVNGVQVPESNTDGYSYDASNNSISFHGSGVPVAGAKISVAYDPTSLR